MNVSEPSVVQAKLEPEEQRKLRRRLVRVLPVQLAAGLAIVPLCVYWPDRAAVVAPAVYVSQFLLLVWWTMMGRGAHDIRFFGYFAGMAMITGEIFVLSLVTSPSVDFDGFAAMYFVGSGLLTVCFVPYWPIRSYYSEVVWFPPSQREKHAPRGQFSLADLFVFPAVAGVLFGLVRLAAVPPWELLAPPLLWVLGSAIFTHTLAWASLSASSPWMRLAICSALLPVATGTTFWFLFERHASPRLTFLLAHLLSNFLVACSIAATFLYVRSCGYRIQRPARVRLFTHPSPPSVSADAQATIFQ